MKKTIKKRALVSAIAMLIVSAIVLTSATFAWFSMSKQATIDSMDLTVSSPEGIQISANASAWTASLTIDELFNTDDATTSRYDAYTGNNNLYPADLIPVSSTFYSATDGVVDFFKATLNDSRYATVTPVSQVAGNADNAGLIAFDLFFKVAAETKVYFGTSEFVDSSNSDILTALRVGFAFLGNAAIGTPAAEVTALKSFVRGTSNICYEVDSMNRSADAAAGGLTTGAITTSYILGTNASGTVNANSVLNPGAYVNTTYAKPVADQAAATDKAFTLSAGMTKVRVYIWVEGNDVDCQNSVAGAALTAALKFTID